MCRGGCRSTVMTGCRARPSSEWGDARRLPQVAPGVHGCPDRQAGTPTHAGCTRDTRSVQGSGASAVHLLCFSPACARVWAAAGHRHRGSPQRGARAGSVSTERPGAGTHLAPANNAWLLGVGRLPQNSRPRLCVAHPHPHPHPHPGARWRPAAAHRWRRGANCHHLCIHVFIRQIRPRPGR
jgi:hypothetical protein